MLTSGSVVSPTFFNREKEMTQMIDCLKTRPAVNVFTGPPNCGKTTLLRHVFDQLVPDRHIISIDLKEFQNANTFLCSLEEKLTPWLIRASKLGQLFDFITQITPFWTAYRHRILFIDEAHRMNDLIGFDSDCNDMESFLCFLVLCTYKFSRFDVLASSDSFYHLWLSKIIRADQFRTFTIGNLTKDDAKKYWEEHVLKNYCHKSVMGTPLFEDAYSACGGNIHLLNEYAAGYYITKGNLVPEKFHFVLQQRAKLTKALGEKSAGWNQTTLLNIMAKLIESEHGFLFYNKLCNEYGEKMIDSIIKANLLHLRPTGTHSYDLVNAPDEAILTADSPASALAMKLILEEHSDIN